MLSFQYSLFLPLATCACGAECRWRTRRFQNGQYYDPLLWRPRVPFINIYAAASICLQIHFACTRGNRQSIVRITKCVIRRLIRFWNVRSAFLLSAVYSRPIVSIVPTLLLFFTRSISPFVRVHTWSTIVTRAAYYDRFFLFLKSYIKININPGHSKYDRGFFSPPRRQIDYGDDNNNNWWRT